VTDEIIAFKGEMMLLNWSETKQGRNVVFLLDEESDIHPFKKFTTKKGKRAGQRFMAVLVELNDDDTPIVQEQEKPKGGPLSKSAALLCQNEKFQSFLSDEYPGMWDRFESDTSEEKSTYVIKSVCGVSSRAELDHVDGASKKFHALMREYGSWCVKAERGVN